MPKGIPRDTSAQRNIIHRYKIARGHLDKVISMAENNEYCVDVVHQSLAVSAALKKANLVLLENHLRTCVAGSIKKGDKEVIDEIIDILNKT